MDVPQEPIVKEKKGWHRAYNKGISCPNCGCLTSRRITTRMNGNDEIRRRRECEKCAFRFTTYESIPVSRTPLMVIKRDGSREPFDELKLKRSIALCSVNRAIGKDRISRIVRNIQLTILKRNKNEDSSKNTADVNSAVIENQVHSSYLGSMILLSLKQLDHVSYIRYASIHLHFTTKEEFSSLIASLY